jgi:hypothetical protein
MCSRPPTVLSAGLIAIRATTGWAVWFLQDVCLMCRETSSARENAFPQKEHLT